VPLTQNWCKRGKSGRLNQRKPKPKRKKKKRHKQTRGKRQKLEEDKVPDIPCPWKKYGCPITLPLSDLSSHLNKYLAEHLAIVDRAFERQREQLTLSRNPIVSPPLKPSVPDPPGSGNGSSGSRILVKNEGLDLELSRKSSTESSASSTEIKEIKINEEPKEVENLPTPGTSGQPLKPRFTVRIITPITDAGRSTPEDKHEPFETPYNSTSFLLAQRGQSPFWSGPPETPVPGMATPVNELFAANSVHSFDQYGTHTDPEQLYGEFMDSPIRPDDDRSSPANYSLSPSSTSPRSSLDALSPRDTFSPASTPKTPIAAAPLSLTSSTATLELSNRTDNQENRTDRTDIDSVPITNPAVQAVS